MLPPFSAFSQIEKDVLDIFRERLENSSRRETKTDEDGNTLYLAGYKNGGAKLFSEFGDLKVDAAISELKEFKRPWTVPKLIEWLEKPLNEWLESPTDRSFEKERLILHILLKSKDERAYNIGVRYREFPQIDIRVQAYLGLYQFYFEEQKAHLYRNGGQPGGLQGEMILVDRWIEEELKIESHNRSGDGQ